MRERLEGLDGWRAISALMVVAAHLQLYSSMKFAAPFIDTDYGKLGVQFFFGISGFVICRGFMREGDVNLPAFYVRRFFRIVPPLALYVFTIVALARLQIIDRDAALSMRALTFTCNLPAADWDCGAWFGAHMWSLSVEEQFYLVIPFLFVLIRPKWLLSLTILVLPLVVLLLFSLKQKDVASFGLNFVTIGLGVCAALNEAWVRALVMKVPSWTVALALMAIVAMWLIPVNRLATTLHVLCIPPLIIFVLMASTFKKSRLRSMLGSRPMRTLGVMSYSFYLWQQLATFAYPGRTVWFYMLTVSLCAGASFASYRWFETPLIAVGARISARLRRLPEAAVA